MKSCRSNKEENEDKKDHPSFSFAVLRAVRPYPLRPSLLSERLEQIIETIVASSLPRNSHMRAVTGLLVGNAEIVSRLWV